MTLNLSQEYASSVAQNNFICQTATTYYILDQKILSVATLLFKQIPQNGSFVGFSGKPYTVTIEEGEESSLRRLLNFVFYHTLNFNDHIPLNYAESIKTLEVWKKWCDKDFVSALKNRFDVMFGNKSIPEIYTEDLHGLEQLQFSALQQNVNQYFDLIRALKIPGLKKQVLELDQNNRNFIFRTVGYFEPKQFELLFFKIQKDTELHFLIDTILNTYLTYHRHRLDDISYQIDDRNLKSKFMMAIPCIESRMALFSSLNIKFPQDVVREGIIDPCIALKLFDDAIDWIEDTDDKKSAEKLFPHLIGPIYSHYASGFAEQFNLPLPNELVKSAERDGQEDEFIYKEALYRSPVEMIRSVLTRTLRSSGFKKENVAGTIKCKLAELFEMTWTKELALITIREYIALRLLDLENKVSASLKEAHCSTNAHDRFLHPSFLEDLNNIKQWVSQDLLPHFKISFNDDEMATILGEDQDLINYQSGSLKDTEKKQTSSNNNNDDTVKFQLPSNKLMNLVISVAKTAYRLNTSLKEEFIVQEVSNYLQPYLTKYRYYYGGEDEIKSPFILKLRNSIRKVKLGKGLTEDDIDLAIHTYLRKSLEAANFYNFPFCDQKLFPEHHSFQISCLQHGEGGLEFALNKDFLVPLESNREWKLGLRMAEKWRKRLTGLELLREIFMESSKAYYRTFIKEKVVYQYYFPDKKSFG